MIILQNEDYEKLKQLYVNLGVIILHAEYSNEEQALIARQEKLIAPLIRATKSQPKQPQIEHIEGDDDGMPKKLKYGKGTISLRQRTNKDGTIRRYWQGRIYHNGKQIPVYARTQAECLKKMDALRTELKGEPVLVKPSEVVQPSETAPTAHSSTTFASWLDEWMSEFKENKVRLRYYRDLCRYVQKIKAALGNLKLKRIEPMDILRFFNSLPRTNATAKLYVALNDCLQRAEDYGYIKKNPCKVVAKPKYAEQTRRPFELEEQNAILSALSDRYKAVFFFLCATGLRIGEFLALTPQSVDFAHGCIKVEESQNLETRENGDTKTAASVRKVYFAEEIFDRFDVQSLGGFTYNGIKKAFTKVYAALNVQGVSATHSCRHTFASLLYAAGVPEKVIQKQCGHSDVSTTMKIYTDILTRGESPIYEYILRLKAVLAEHFQMR